MPWPAARIPCREARLIGASEYVRMLRLRRNNESSVLVSCFCVMRSPVYCPYRYHTCIGSVGAGWRSEEHTSELQSLMRISYAVFCLKKKIKQDIATQQLKYYLTSDS